MKHVSEAKEEKRIYLTVDSKTKSDRRNERMTLRTVSGGINLLITNELNAAKLLTVPDLTDKHQSCN